MLSPRQAIFLPEKSILLSAIRSRSFSLISIVSSVEVCNCLRSSNVISGCTKSPFPDIVLSDTLPLPETVLSDTLPLPDTVLSDTLPLPETVLSDTPSLSDTVSSSVFPLTISINPSITVGSVFCISAINCSSFWRSFVIS